MLDEPCLELALTAPFWFGQLSVRKAAADGFVLANRDDEGREDLQIFRGSEDAVEIAKHDDTGNYRPLKTAPNLRHGWQLELATVEELERALNYFYPGRLPVFAAWKRGELKTTPLRETLDRQSGMYRVAAKVSDDQINDVVAHFCRSDGGCLRTILWKRDQKGTVPSTKLPTEKFDPAWDQSTARQRHAGTSGCDVRTAQPAVPASHARATTIPLLCQEACNLLVSECRKAVKGSNTTNL
jgi:hypothetical protein